MNGEIVWYSPTKHYGFVAPVDGGGDVFFALSPGEAQALGPVAPGLAVHFTLAGGLERGFAPEPLA